MSDTLQYILLFAIVGAAALWLARNIYLKFSGRGGSCCSGAEGGSCSCAARGAGGTLQSPSDLSCCQGAKRNECHIVASHEDKSDGNH